MNRTALTEAVTPLIEKGKYKDALKALSDYVKEKDDYLQNDLLLQTSAFNRNERDHLNGLLSKSDYDISQSRLAYNLTQIIQKLPKEGNEVDIEMPEVKDTRNAITTASRKKKILFLSANPKGTDTLRLGDELRKIKDGLAAATKRGDFELESEPAVKILTITKAMDVHKPQIVHFSGHGIEKGLAVQNDAGETHIFPTKGLDRLFRLFKRHVQCVVLNACYSKEQAEAISQHGIYVIGMSEKIGDDAATNFAIGFYQSLGEGNPYEFAFEIALVNISGNEAYADTPEMWYNGEKLDL